jgi:hypothetical protein
VDLETALTALRMRFGPDNVSIDSSGWVKVLAAPPGSDLMFPLLLTRREAIFLSTNPVPEADLFADSMPDDWPCPTQLVREQFMAWNCSSGETYWINPGEKVQRLGRRTKTVRFFVSQKPELGTLETWALTYARSVMAPRPEL